MKGPRRFLILPDASHAEAARRAFTVLGKVIAENAEIRDVLLLAYAQYSLRAGTTVGDILGKSATKQLIGKKSVPWPNSNATLRFATLRTLELYPEPDVVFVVYASKKLLDLAESLKSVNWVIALAWEAGRIAHWQETWKPVVMR